MLICKYCGKEFKSNNPNPKYCSRKCSDNSKLKGEIKHCKVCNKEFYAPLSQQKRNRQYCSLDCSIKDHTKSIISNCIVCGKEYKISKANQNKGWSKYCSRKCSGIGRTKKQIVKCNYCGKEFEQFNCKIIKNSVNFCSYSCMGKYQSEHRCGEKSSNWKGGLSFEPYCEKFNNEFRSRVRAFWNNTCVLCGTNKTENGREMDVHHIHYDKSSCCSEAPREFVILCRKCHMMTNYDRDYWTNYFHNLICEKYNGKSYFTKDEMIPC